MLLNSLREGREELAKQIENVITKVTLGEWKDVTTKTYRDLSGEIIETHKQTTDLPTHFQFKACLLLQSYHDSELLGEGGKKSEIPSTGAKIPYSEEDDEWLRKCALNKKTNPPQPKKAKKQPKQRKVAVKPIEYAVVEMALGIRKHGYIKPWKVKGEIIGTVERTTTLKPNLKAAKRRLSNRNPERRSEYEKPEILISDIIPDSGEMTPEEWLQEYGPKPPEQKAKSDDK